jgi:hypothetical protein
MRRPPTTLQITELSSADQLKAGSIRLAHRSLVALAA